MIGNLVCPDGCGKKAKRVLLWYLASIEREMRKTYKKNYVLVLNSTVRCKDKNNSIDGSPTSEHLKSDAADIHCKNATERYWLVKSMLHAGIKRILIYTTFIHMGISKTHPQPIISRMK